MRHRRDGGGGAPERGHPADGDPKTRSSPAPQERDAKARSRSIYCVRFSDVLAFLETVGFAQAGETEADLVFLRSRDGAVLTIHRPNQHGDITEAAALAAFDAAEIEPPDLDVHWCD